uniref:Uncharacterized protein n=1 Tax=Cyprinus carpio TaxID=7962 RepID=A0A8C2FEF2_CYPCA
MCCVSVPDELDSYMYQTVGHQAVDLYAEAMDLPLYRRTIEGSSLHTGREYSQTAGDEVEDLYQLLKLVKVLQMFCSIFSWKISISFT